MVAGVVGASYNLEEIHRFPKYFIFTLLCSHFEIRYREEVREMFQHAYNRSFHQLGSAFRVLIPTWMSFLSYLEHAYPYDELRPLSCDGVDTWGSYSLTLIGVSST